MTFEHTPPKAAYNDQPVVRTTFEAWEAGQGGEFVRRGRGDYALCGTCNHRTGGAYGPAFVEWCRSGLDRISQARVRPESMVFSGSIHPLRVIKQIATIFLVTSGDRFSDRNPYLRKFVLDPHQKGLPPDYRFYVFWYGGGNLRSTGVMGALKFGGGVSNVISEFVHPPFGYVLSLHGDLADRRPELINDFAEYDLDDERQIRRRLPVLETHWRAAGDYRTLEQIQRDVSANAIEAERIRRMTPE